MQIDRFVYRACIFFFDYCDFVKDATEKGTHLKKVCFGEKNNSTRYVDSPCF